MSKLEQYASSSANSVMLIATLPAPIRFVLLNVEEFWLIALKVFTILILDWES